MYVDSHFEELLEANEEGQFRATLNSVLDWFAFEVEQYRSGKQAEVDKHVNVLVAPGNTCLDPQFAMRRGFVNPSEATVREVVSSYKLKLRGKTLFSVLLRFLSRPGRAAKHNQGALIEAMIKTGRSLQHLNDLVRRTEEVLAPQVKASGLLP